MDVKKAALRAVEMVEKKVLKKAAEWDILKDAL